MTHRCPSLSPTRRPRSLVCAAGRSALLGSTVLRSRFLPVAVLVAATILGGLVGLVASRLRPLYFQRHLPVRLNGWRTFGWDHPQQLRIPHWLILVQGRTRSRFRRGARREVPHGVRPRRHRTDPARPSEPIQPNRSSPYQSRSCPPSRKSRPTPRPTWTSPRRWSTCSTNPPCPNRTSPARCGPQWRAHSWVWAWVSWLLRFGPLDERSASAVSSRRAMLPGSRSVRRSPTSTIQTRRITSVQTTRRTHSFEPVPIGGGDDRCSWSYSFPAVGTAERSISPSISRPSPPSAAIGPFSSMPISDAVG